MILPQAVQPMIELLLLGKQWSLPEKSEADMATSKTAQLTDFSQDILGRYGRNGFDETMDSMDNNSPRLHAHSDARLFNAIIIGSFDGVLAQPLLYANESNSYQIFVLKAGRDSLPTHFQNLPLQRQPIPRCNWPRKCSPLLASGGHRVEAKAFLSRTTSIRARRMGRNLLATRIKNGAL